MENNVPQEWNKFYLKDVSFVNLMMRRIYNVLIVANPYDAFMLEDDGRIEEKIYNEYMELGLRVITPAYFPSGLDQWIKAPDSEHTYPCGNVFSSFCQFHHK